MEKYLGSEKVKAKLLDGLKKVAGDTAVISTKERDGVTEINVSVDIDGDTRSVDLRFDPSVVDLYERSDEQISQLTDAYLKSAETSWARTAKF